MPEFSCSEYDWADVEKAQVERFVYGRVAEPLLRFSALDAVEAAGEALFDSRRLDWI